MWIVKLALNRPYTFIVMALLILIASPVMILRTPTDIFPNIDIPVISVAWQYAGLNAEEVEGRITAPFERSLTTLVDNIQHLESTSYNGESVIKVFLQPNANLANSMAQVTAVSQQQLKQMPPGEQPPEIINYSASSVPILQIGLSGKGLDEQQLNDLAMNFVRTQIVTVPGAVVPAPYGGKLRQIMVNLDPRRMQARGLSSTDVLHAVAAQNLILPSGTAKIGQDEYDIRLNASLRTVAALNDLPIKQVGAVHHLPARCCHRQRRLYAANQHRPPGWAARGSGPGVEGGQRFHHRRGQRGAPAAAAHCIDRSPAIEDAAPAGSIYFCGECGQRGHSRSDHRRCAHRPDDSALSGQLAQHAHHRDFHSAFHPYLHPYRSASWMKPSTS